MSKVKSKEKEKNEIWYAYERLPIFAQKRVLFAYKRFLKTNTQAFYDRDSTRNIYKVPANRLNFYSEWLGLAIEFKPPNCHVFIQGITDFGEFTEDWFLLEKDAEGNFTEVPVPASSINPRTTIKELIFN